MSIVTPSPQLLIHDPWSFSAEIAPCGRKIAAMETPTEDRSAWDDLLKIASGGTRGVRGRLRFLFTFTPERVMALLTRLNDHDRVLQFLENSWHKDSAIWQEAAEKYEQKLERVKALIPRWKERTPPNVVNGWAAELEEALADLEPLEPAESESDAEQPEPKVTA